MNWTSVPYETQDN